MRSTHILTEVGDFVIIIGDVYLNYFLKKFDFPNDREVVEPFVEGRSDEITAEDYARFFRR